MRRWGAEVLSEVVVLDKAPGPRPQGYMIDFSGPGYDAADAMGVLPRLQELGYRFEEASWLDETGRCRARLRFEQFGKIVQARLFSILRPDLEQALREELSRQHRPALRHQPVRHAQHHRGRAGHAARRRHAPGRSARWSRRGSPPPCAVWSSAKSTATYLGFHTAAFVFDDQRIHAEVAGRFA